MTVWELINSYQKIKGTTLQTELLLNDLLKTSNITFYGFIADVTKYSIKIERIFSFYNETIEKCEIYIKAENLSDVDLLQIQAGALYAFECDSIESIYSSLPFSDWKIKFKFTLKSMKALNFGIVDIINTEECDYDFNFINRFRKIIYGINSQEGENHYRIYLTEFGTYNFSFVQKNNYLFFPSKRETNILFNKERAEIKIRIKECSKSK